MKIISSSDIRKGDKIRAEFTTLGVRVQAAEYVADFDGDIYSSWATIYYLMERPIPLPTHPFAVIKVRSFTPIIREEDGTWHHANLKAMETQYTQESLWEMIQREADGDFDILYTGYDNGFND